MSVIRFGASKIGLIASSLFRNHRHFLWSEQERCMFIEHARHANALFKNFEDSEDMQQMNHLRWLFERVNLANQLQHAKHYSKYDETLSVTYDTIEMYTQEELTATELHSELYSLRYNSDEFMDKDDYERNSKWIAMLASESIFKQKREREEKETLKA